MIISSVENVIILIWKSNDSFEIWGNWNQILYALKKVTQDVNYHIRILKSVFKKCIVSIVPYKKRERRYYCLKLC
jgi:hypothetical protein